MSGSMGLRVYTGEGKVRLDTDTLTMRVVHTAYLPARRLPVGPDVVVIYPVPGLTVLNGVAMLNRFDAGDATGVPPPIYSVRDGGVEVRYAGSTFINTHYRDYTIWSEYQAYQLIVAKYQ